MKRLIYLRKRFRAFGRGTLEMLHPANRKVLAFLRSYERENVLVVANLSRFAQYVEIDLSAFKGLTPVELFGRNEFPRVGDKPYFLTLGPHAFYWFSLENRAPVEVAGAGAGAEPPAVVVGEKWEEVFEGPPRDSLEEALVKYNPGTPLVRREGPGHFLAEGEGRPAPQQR
jgi:maltose alpha-D-glucosyltransferase/alpha-amylase